MSMSQAVHYVTGRLGIDEGFAKAASAFTEDDHAIDVDDDGVYSPTEYGIIDLSHALSVTLGKQIPQCAVYRVGSIEIGLRNKDDTNDNNGAGFFGGTVFYYEPNKHNVDAVQLARRTDKAAESTDIDGDSWLLSTSKSYRNFRLNFDADNQISNPVSEGFSAIAGGQWSLSNIFGAYNDMMGGDSDDVQWTNANWQYRTGVPTGVQWVASIVNRVIGKYTLTSVLEADLDGGMDVHPSADNHQLVAPGGTHFPVLNGLMKLTIAHCLAGGDGMLVDDDYEIQVTIGVLGWESF